MNRNRTGHILLLIVLISCTSFRFIKAEDEDDGWWDDDEDSDGENGTEGNSAIEQIQQKRFTREGFCDHSAFTTVILKILLDIQESMIKGDSEAGLPPLDPLNITHVAFNTTGTKYKYKINGEARNIKVSGLSTFNITDIQSDLDDLVANISIALDAMTIEGRYNLNGKIARIFPIHGKGYFRLRPKRLEIDLKSKFGFTNGTLKLLHFDFGIKLEELFVKFDGLGAGAAMTTLVNRVINAFGMKLFDKIEPRIHEKVRERTITEINKILHVWEYDEETLLQMLQIPLRCMFG